MAGELERVKEEIRRRSDLVELVGHRVSLKKAGKTWKGLCPFHDDKNPSFIVSPEYGHYRCWSCGAKGDVFNWVMETQRVDFIEALRILARETGVELPQFNQGEKSDSEEMELAMAEAQSFFREQLRSEKTALHYIEERGLDQSVIDHWEIGYAPHQGEALAVRLKKKGFALATCQKLFLVEEDQRGGYYDRFRSRLMFPIRDERGRLVAFGGRIIGAGNPKYINSSDTPLYSKSRVLYGMDKAKESISKEDQAVLVEGYMDVIACHRAGVTQAVASLGTALAEDHVRLLKRWCSKVVVLYDSDDAGKKAADRAAAMISEAGLVAKISLLAPGEDPDTLLKTKGAGAVKVAVDQGISPMDFRMAMLNEKLSADDDSYWTEVVQVLATAETPLELQKYLIPVSAQYPGISDRQAAAKALERMVQAERKRLKTVVGRRSYTEPEESLEKVESIASKLVGSERVLFRSIFEPGLRQHAWQFAKFSPLMQTDKAQSVAQVLAEVGELPEAENWLNLLEDGEVKDYLFELALESREPIGIRNLEEAVDWLTKEKVRREARENLVDHGDESLRAFLNKRKETNKGSKDY
ncbi:MAG: DNA primase [Fimbriimonadaceae bacterium]|nr:MAG: DNA primase [Fimbriimonadaceae bacterium]